MTKKDAMIQARIFILEMTERQWVEQNSNGWLDNDLYKLRKELDTLRKIIKKS